MSYILHAALYGCAMGAVYGACLGGYTEIKKYIEKRKSRKASS